MERVFALGAAELLRLFPGKPQELGGSGERVEVHEHVKLIFHSPWFTADQTPPLSHFLFLHPIYKNQ